MLNATSLIHHNNTKTPVEEYWKLVLYYHLEISYPLLISTGFLKYPLELKKYFS